MSAGGLPPESARLPDGRFPAQYHKMKKSKHMGADFWTCPACGFTTEREIAAKEHEAQPY